ncbi:Tetratricopeptide repeat protein 1 [Temnothorax longispinosus]|uniref:Tetratricopeptide repeat protein 1 n=1 Tax=Temnothorax longispinosus TaxID=300112 RepID=A0A4S2KKX2_9HYME|nr:Tetratricopeptide repeat protein 1 [Temnothorax longispinosus]
MNNHIRLAVANTEAHAKKALQALRNPGQARLLLPLHLRPFLVETFQYSERSSLLSVNNSYNKKNGLPDFIDVSIFLISPYSIAASQDKAISQNVINTAANHKDMIRISDLLHPQESLCRLLDNIRDLCRLQLKNTRPSRR